MQKRVLDITLELIVLKKTLRVAVYTRVSCEKDTMIHSLKAQIDYYKHYIEASPDYEFVGVFADEGIIDLHNVKQAINKQTRRDRVSYKLKKYEILEECSRLEDYSYAY